MLNYVTFGELIKSRRNAMGLSQRALGQMIGCGGDTICNAETGKTRHLQKDLWQKASEVLKIPMEELARAANEAPSVHRINRDRPTTLDDIMDAITQLSQRVDALEHQKAASHGNGSRRKHA